MHPSFPALALAALAALAAPAGAAQRTFVSSIGNDVDTCSLSSPCRGFARALTQTDAGGEIVVLDSAGYGPVTIDKGVSIIAPAGVYAGVTTGSGNGIVVNAPGAHVVLRGLDINGLGTSQASGILHQAAASLRVDRCTVSGFATQTTGSGIRILAGPVTVSQSLVRNNLRGGLVVIGSDPNNPLRVTVEDSKFEGNGLAGYAAGDAAVAAQSAALVTVSNSAATGNFRGFSACGDPFAAAGATISVEGSLADRNVVGLFAGVNQGACAMRVSGSTITDSSLYGIEQQGASQVTSLGNNFVYGNAAAETFGTTTTPK